MHNPDVFRRIPSRYLSGILSIASWIVLWSGVDSFQGSLSKGRSDSISLKEKSRISVSKQITAIFLEECTGGLPRLDFGQGSPASSTRLITASRTR
jgi:hypothetical protein